MLIDRDDVKTQLEKCRLFFNTMHDKEHIAQNNNDDIDEDEYEKDDATGGKEEEENDPTK